MKNRYAIVFAFAMLLTVFSVSNASAYCVSPPGDINGMNGSDVSDVQCSILTTLWALTGGGKPYPICVKSAWERADLNCDKVVDVTDSLLVIQTALGQEFNVLIDADQNGCPNACGDCGDGTCGSGETCGNCEFDCDSCTGSCCELHVGIGCDNSFIQSCVCAIDNFCCAILWDDGCAAMSIDECGMTCPENCGDNICDSNQEDCDNCAADCGACTGTCGDGTCGDGPPLLYEDCISCAADCGTCDGNCCETSTNFGCDDATVQSCVCNVDPFCCVLGWDPACVNRAVDACSAVCTDVCGDGVCTSGESCSTCSEDCSLCSCDNGTCDYEKGETCGNCQVDCGACDGNCCLNNGSPGCDTPTIQDCVCDKYPTCCNVTWGNICGLRAADLCEATCGSNECGDGICNSAPEGAEESDFESCSSCPTDCGVCPSPCGDNKCSEDENCFDCSDDCGDCLGICDDDNGTPGCCDDVIQECLCVDDPYCCNTEWDATCALKAIANCGALGIACPAP